MIVSPLDYELYSRVTGQPIPMSAAERMKMAPAVNEFTKNYTKAQNRQSLGRNILKIGALGALGAGMYYGLKGSRDFGTPSQELGQEITETSTGSNLIQKAADNAAASASTDTISDSLTNSEDQFPQQTEENAVASTTPPSQLNINESVEASVKKPTPNIDAALERKNVRKPTPSVARGKYQQYETTTNPEERQERNLAAMVGGGEIFLKEGKKKGEVVKTEEAQLYGDKGEKQLLGKYVGMMKGKVDPSLKEVSGQTTDTTGPELLVDDTFGSPLVGHPDLPPGEDDIALPGGMNTSATSNLGNVDPKKVMAMAVISSGNVSDVLNKELSKKTPEEKLVIATEIEKRRTPNSLEQTTPRSPNELAGKDQAAFEAIQAGIPQEEQEAAAKRVKEKTERKRPQTTTEKVDNFTANFVEGAKSDIIRGQRGNKSLGLTSIPATNGDAQTGFVLANRPLDQSPTTATTFNFGVDASGEDYLKDYPVTEQNFDAMMDRGLGESKRKKRQAGQIFSYLKEADRNVTGQAQLGGFGNIDPNYNLPSRRD